MTTLSTFTGLISPVSRRLAEKWSKQQATPQKGQQVLLNTLSVSFVNFYLECMGFETELETSDSWNPVQQTLMDVADLCIKDLGKLECRPVLENSQTVCIPPEVTSDRIGYVAVQISETLQEAKLLGFVKETSMNNLPIDRLEPLENLLEYLEECTQLQKAKPSTQKFVNLQKWLENSFEAVWQPIESIFQNEPALQFRSPKEGFSTIVERAKLIDFGIQANSTSVGIVVKVSQEQDNKNEIKITVELHPNNGQEYLPPLLHVMVLDEEETAIMEAKAKNDNKKIQLQLSASPGDNFSVKITMGDVSVIENFVI
ncbi:DUF1822 family protein [Scytonema sp. UIC 10036]|uniref:DUF1822 family protein n=1 Tax=Scytonema sp. UIC 10036 TaxID=2304196 RepID=UPI0012DA6A46|nr:DUF1822 family protein [Scytonema sp. UIC 10036]MUG94135.1 DUF1822 family protein [Scytonema sp. UIC 10036]